MGQIVVLTQRGQLRDKAWCFDHCSSTGWSAWLHMPLTVAYCLKPWWQRRWIKGTSAERQGRRVALPWIMHRQWGSGYCSPRSTKAIRPGNWDLRAVSRPSPRMQEVVWATVLAAPSVLEPLSLDCKVPGGPDGTFWWPSGEITRSFKESG